MNIYHVLLGLIAVIGVGCHSPHVKQSPQKQSPIKIASSTPPSTPVSSLPEEKPTNVSSPEEKLTRDNTSSAAERPTHEAEQLKMVLPMDDAYLQALPRGRASYKRWRETGRIRVGKGYLYQAFTTPDQQTILVQSADEKGVRIYDRKRKSLNTQHNFPYHFAMAPWPFETDEAAAYLLSGPNGLVKKRIRDGKETLLYAETFDSIRWSLDRQVLIATTFDIPTQTSILFFFVPEQTGALSLKGRFSMAERVDGVHLSPDNRYLATADYPSYTLTVTDLHTGEPVWRILAPQYAGAVAFSPDGRALAVGGDSLLVVDLAEPTNRILADKYENNISQITFSPSGDALVTTSYDGRIRIFKPDMKAGVLPLIKTLSHNGSANVYDAQFIDNGYGLVTASGDRTVRLFGETPRTQSTEKAGAPRKRLTLPKALEVSATRSQLANMSGDERKSLLASLHQTPRHRPALLDAPPKSAALAPGAYVCKISRGYRLRECSVETLPTGHTVIDIPNGLLPLKAVIYDDGPILRMEGWPTAKQPFGCNFGCTDDCFVSPESCDCDPAPPERIRACLSQPIHGVLKKKGNTWKGIVLHHSYHDKHVRLELPGKNFKFQDGNNRKYVEIKPAPKRSKEDRKYD